MASEWLDLGRGTLVRRSEIAAVHDGFDEEQEPPKLAVVPWGNVKCLVVLRSGRVLPCYIRVETVRRRLRRADGGEQA